MNESDFHSDAYLLANPDVERAISNGQFSSAWEHYVKHGIQENRPLERLPAQLTRVDKALSALNIKGKGLEIGPSHNPIAPKRDGFDVDILDHLSAADLRHKYAEHSKFGVDLNKIEEVDYVWAGEPLTQLIGKKNYYDWVIASHVIEHVPDLISFLQQCSELIKPGGIISLVIPDKRYCFDYFSPLTTTGGLLDAYGQKRQRPTPGQLFDHISNATTLNGMIAWSATDSVAKFDFELLHRIEDAKKVWHRAINTSEYIDTHCWRFVPDSFKLIISDLRNLGLLDLGTAIEFPTEGCEFYISLNRGTIKPETLPIRDRLSILQELSACLKGK